MFAFAIYFLMSGIFLYLSQLMTCSFIIGSWHSYFSASNISIPVFVAHFNIVYALLYYGAKAFFAKNGFVFLLKKISLLSSGAAYKKHSVFFSFIIPAVCMALFMSHALGVQVFWYSFFWFIPMALYFMPQKYDFFLALSSTFVAHAIGSVVWLYVYNLEPHYFVMAAPFVLFERCAVATGIVCFDRIVSVIKEKGMQAWKQAVGALL